LKTAVTAKQTPDFCSLEHLNSIYSLKSTEGSGLLLKHLKPCGRF